MTALSIRHQRFTLREREFEQSRRDAELFENLPEDVKAIKCYYWHIEHRPRRTWRLWKDFYGSEADLAALWLKHIGTKPNFRLRCFETSYTKKS